MFQEVPQAAKEFQSQVCRRSRHIRQSPSHWHKRVKNVSQSVHQSVSQSATQSVNQSVTQPMSQLVKMSGIISRSSCRIVRFKVYL